MAAVIFSFSAVIQIGSPPHQTLSALFAALFMAKERSSAGSKK
jgi:hypothetical protein